MLDFQEAQDIVKPKVYTIGDTSMMYLGEPLLDILIFLISHLSRCTPLVPQIGTSDPKTGTYDPKPGTQKRQSKEISREGYSWDVRDPHVGISQTPPWDVPEKNFMQGAFFCCFRLRKFREGMAGTSRDLGRDVPGSEKTLCKKSLGLFLVPSTKKRLKRSKPALRCPNWRLKVRL